ncbi:MAG: hypothetical protein AAB639_03065 [Patescibacteria group bacterium]
MVKLSKENLPKVNLLFIFIFLNIWDFVVSREILNAMVLGIIMFSPAAFLWYIGTLRAIVLLTMISIFEFTVILVFILQGFELGGLDTTIKSIFWLPYLAMAGVNGFLGLKIYSEVKERKIKYQQNLK